MGQLAVGWPAPRMPVAWKAFWAAVKLAAVLVQQVVGEQVVLPGGVGPEHGHDLGVREVALELRVDLGDGRVVPGGDLAQEDLVDDRGVDLEAVDPLAVVAVEVEHEREAAGHVRHVLVGDGRRRLGLLRAVGDVRGGEVDLVLGEVVEPDHRRLHLPVDVEPIQRARLAHPLLDGHGGEAGPGRLHRRAGPGRCHAPEQGQHGHDQGGRSGERPATGPARPVLNQSGR